MPTNIEIKAKARDPQRQEQLAAGLSTGALEVLDQVDTFFNVASGRLKLRELASTHGELIHYEREDIAGPKSCKYSIIATDQPAAMRKLLGDALGVPGEVRKRRKVYHAGQTRIHFDEVVGLGTFLELEVVLRPEQSREEGERIARAIMERLEIRESELIEGAYIDLIVAEVGAATPTRPEVKGYGKGYSGQ